MSLVIFYILSERPSCAIQTH